MKITSVFPLEKDKRHNIYCVKCRASSIELIWNTSGGTLYICNVCDNTFLHQSELKKN